MKNFKSLVVFALVLFFIPQMVYARDKGKVGGIRGGWQSSGLFNPKLMGELHDGFYAGFYRDNKLAPCFAFRTGVEYMQNGSENVFGSDYKMHAVSVPMSLKFKLGPVYVLGGIAANYNWDAKTFGDDLKINHFDFPVHAGLGVQIFMFGIEARYNHALRDITKGEFTSRANYFQLGATLSF